VSTSCSVFGGEDLRRGSRPRPACAPTSSEVVPDPVALSPLAPLIARMLFGVKSVSSPGTSHCGRARSRTALPGRHLHARRQTTHERVGAGSVVDHVTGQRLDMAVDGESDATRDIEGEEQRGGARRIGLARIG
jgi:hypothetical protein